MQAIAEPAIGARAAISRKPPATSRGGGSGGAKSRTPGESISSPPEGSDVERGRRRRVAAALARARDLRDGRLDAGHERVGQRTLAHARLADQDAGSARKALAQRADAVREPLAGAHDGVADARIVRERRLELARSSGRSHLFATTQAASPFHSAAARYRSQSPKSGAGTGASTATICVRLAATGSAVPRASIRASSSAAAGPRRRCRRRPRCLSATSARGRRRRRPGAGPGAGSARGRPASSTTVASRPWLATTRPARGEPLAAGFHACRSGASRAMRASAGGWEA